MRPNPGPSKSSRFSAAAMALEDLLRYTEDDTKEATFEVRILLSRETCHSCVKQLPNGF